MITTSTLIDNSCEQLSMMTVVRDLLAQPQCSKVKIATGYWDIPGMALLTAELRHFLQREGTQLQILIGTDPRVRASQQRNPIYKDAHSQQDFIKCDLQNLDVKDEYVDAVCLLKEFCTEDFDASRIQIKMCREDAEGREQFFHAKSYVFLGRGFAKGIVGSSNFTQKGLQGNAELNYLEWTDAIVTHVPCEESEAKGHKYWFDEKWEQAEEWNRVFLQEVLQGTPVAAKAETVMQPAPLTPYELYIKLLHYKFGDIVDVDQQHLIEGYLPPQYEALDYQIQAVKQCFSIMREHGGFMLADVVGLGKTVVGALIMKHFLTMPDEHDAGRPRRVLVVTPPAIKSAWQDTIGQFDQHSSSPMQPFVDFVTTGSIGHLVDDVQAGEADEDDDADSGDFASTLQQKDYGLILIDESHKFRNSGTRMYQTLDQLIADIITHTALCPYVGLLSATPQNNRPSDLQNQIYLFQRNRADSTLRKANGGNLESYFAAIKREYAELIATPLDEKGRHVTLTPHEKAERSASLKRLSERLRADVLEDILVRRTRTDIIRYYGGTLKFPTISGPHSLEYTMEAGLAQLFAQTMDMIAPAVAECDTPDDFLGYYRYRAIEYLVDPEVKNIYCSGNLSPDRISHQLAKIMQTNLVKRLESSFAAFKKSLRNLRRYTQNMIDMWHADAIFICPNIDVNAELDASACMDREGRYVSFGECLQRVREKLRRLNEQGRNELDRNRELRRADFDPAYIDYLNRDLGLIKYLCDKWDAYGNDPKLETFKQSLRTTLFDPARNPARKLVIFSEAIDTVETLALAVRTVAPELGVLCVTAANRHDMEPVIRQNFDANYRGIWCDDYQVIITTEVLAEGINLHRANCILNYDTPWNATRLMQRIGRVNRIGSQADTVYVYNFMPSAQGNEQIQLVQKAYTKLQSFHTLFGEDSQVFTQDEEVMHYDLNLQVNGEESPMEKYISELKAYKTAHPARFAQIEAMHDGLQVAAAPTTGHSYFVVRTATASALFVHIDEAGQAKLLSAADMYAAFRTDPAVPAAHALPANWEQRCKEATLLVNQSLAVLRLHSRYQRQADSAKEIIRRLKDELPLTPRARSILSSAFSLVDKGNTDIIRKVIALDERMHGERLLLEFTPEEVENILQTEIAHILARVKKRHGQATVYLALAK